MTTFNGYTAKIRHELRGEKRLGLVHEDLSEMPYSVLQRYSLWAEVVDVSHNYFRDVRFLAHFDRMHTAILDHNLVDSNAMFPSLPDLQTLWINYNRIANINSFIPMLSQRCPNLIYLSLLGNPGAPSDLTGDTMQENARYRVFVLKHFPKLKYLDDRIVASNEKEKSLTPRSRSSSLSQQIFVSFNSVVESAFKSQKYSKSVVRNRII